MSKTYQIQYIYVYKSVSLILLFFNSFSLFYHQFSTLRQKESGAVHRHATFDLLSRPKGAGVKLGHTKGETKSWLL